MVDAVKGLRTDYEQTHPELAAFKAWASDARKQADKAGGTASWRVQMARENPNAAQYFGRQGDAIRRRVGKGLTPSQLSAELDKASFTLSAYLAYEGRQEKLADPSPAKTDVPILGPMGTGTGSGSGTGGQNETFSAKLARVVPATLAALGRANADASARSGHPIDVLNQPEAIRAWLLAKYPDLTSDDARIAFEYLDWSAARRAQGLNDSQAAYVREQGWQANNAAPPNALQVALQGGANTPYANRFAPSLTGR